MSLAWSGSVDSVALARISVELESVLKKSPEVLRLDLRHVTALSASALSLLVATHHRLAARQARLVLLGCSPRLQRVLAHAGVHRQLLGPTGFRPDLHIVSGQ